MEKTAAVVLLSGGQDSTTCLFWALREFHSVRALSIFYGQRHQVELEAAKQIAGVAGVPHEVLSIEGVLDSLADSALVSGGDVAKEHRVGGLPASFVPGRNVFFLATAAAFAFKYGIQNLVTGTCQTDYSGYPDCRDGFIKSMQVTLSLALGTDFIIHTPLMWLTKAETVYLAANLPGCLEALSLSHTCYEGWRPPCGECPACVLRAKGFAEAGVQDPLFRGRGIL
jgi:7-cyano-7-deazaguanine synthase